ncbi:hypothetical protein [Pilimelia columellifera]|uniref:Uncharacterized protein n=1 Tax=Pilimelia columellifera subsp. columellifera TaxID=706583 RepID=A0ABP6ANN2_9ACTN
MFLQAIIGEVADLDDLRASLRRWMTDLAPHATGWQGGTAGVTADGTFVGLVRFDTVAAARRNSDRPEQHQWWMETAKAFAAEPRFLDCDRVAEYLGGPSQQAGFVQVILSHGANFERLNSLMAPYSGMMREQRPDILGGISGATADNQFVDTVYFTSEAAARAGEAKPALPELADVMAEYDQLMTIDRYLDIADPWHFSPGTPVPS